MWLVSGNKVRQLCGWPIGNAVLSPEFKDGPLSVLSVQNVRIFEAHLSVPTVPFRVFSYMFCVVSCDVAVPARIKRDGPTSFV
jgi:hypothetical protein